MKRKKGMGFTAGRKDRRKTLQQIRAITGKKPECFSSPLAYFFSNRVSSSGSDCSSGKGIGRLQPICKTNPHEDELSLTSWQAERKHCLLDDAKLGNRVRLP